MLSLFGTVILLVLLVATPAFAHDCWLQPDHFTIGMESLIIARLFVGHRLKKDKALPLEKAMTPRLGLVTAEKEIDLISMTPDGHMPIVDYQPAFQGPGLLVMDRDFTPITLANDKFGQYLSHEHHERLMHLVEANPRGEQKERYARCVKVLIQVGGLTEEKLYDRMSGQKLEIVLRSDPARIKPDDSLMVDVFFEGKPLGDSYVTALVMTPEGKVVEAFEKTNSDGMAVFKSTRPGIWLLRLVHLYPYGGDHDMDWESYWAAYCFEITS